VKYSFEKRLITILQLQLPVFPLLSPYWRLNVWGVASCPLKIFNTKQEMWNSRFSDE
jgi:hypothetical protein